MLYGRKPTDEQIAYHLGVSVERVREAQKLAEGEMLPLEAIPGEGMKDNGGRMPIFYRRLKIIFLILRDIIHRPSILLHCLLLHER